MARKNQTGGRVPRHRAAIYEKILGSVYAASGARRVSRYRTAAKNGLRDGSVNIDGPAEIEGAEATGTFHMAGYRSDVGAFYGIADVSVSISLGMTTLFLAVCLSVVWWIFKTGYRLKR